MRANEVVPLTEIFKEDADDTDWLYRLGEQGDWVVITLDRRISRNQLAGKKDWKKGFGYLTPFTGRIRAMDLATGMLRKIYCLVQVAIERLFGVKIVLFCGEEVCQRYA